MTEHLTRLEKFCDLYELQGKNFMLRDKYCYNFFFTFYEKIMILQCWRVGVCGIVTAMDWPFMMRFFVIKLAWSIWILATTSEDLLIQLWGTLICKEHVGYSFWFDINLYGIILKKSIKKRKPTSFKMFIYINLYKFVKQ